MIAKWYEVTCDYCGFAMNHYPGRKPTPEELRSDGFICTSTKQFCSEECFANWNHDRQEKQYLNLKQNGKLTHGEPDCNAKELDIPLFVPRELCLSCYNWLTQADVGPHNHPSCTDSDKTCCRDYLYHRREDCPNHLFL